MPFPVALCMPSDPTRQWQQSDICTCQGRRSIIRRPDLPLLVSAEVGFLRVGGSHGGILQPVVNPNSLIIQELNKRPVLS